MTPEATGSKPIVAKSGLSQTQFKGKTVDCAAPQNGLTLSVQDIINALPFYVMILDGEHNIIDTNEAVFGQLGVNREDILGKYCPLVIHGIDKPFKGCPLEEASEKNQAVERELQDEKTGHWVRSIVYPIQTPNPDGRKLFLHIVMDVTERKQAEDDLKTSHQQLRRLSAHLESVREEEKKKIARDLHDEASQLLASLNVHLQAAIGTLPPGMARTEDFLKKSQEIALRILDELHKLIYDLRPTMLDELGLMPAISSLADSHLTVSGVKVSLKSSGQVKRLPQSLETTLFRIVQEAFNNIVRHAHARHVRVSVAYRKAHIKIVVKDDGAGFNVNEVMTSKIRPRGLGLLGMEERIKLLDGSLTVKSSPGKGAEITVSVPLNSEVNSNG